EGETAGAGVVHGRVAEAALGVADVRAVEVVSGGLALHEGSVREHRMPCGRLDALDGIRAGTRDPMDEGGHLGPGHRSCRAEVTAPFEAGGHVRLLRPRDVAAELVARRYIVEGLAAARFLRRGGGHDAEQERD